MQLTREQLDMGERRFRIIVVAVLAALALLTRVAMAEEEQTILISSSYYRCIRPERVSCVTYTEEDKQKCRQCSEWTNVITVRPSVVPAIDPSVYQPKRKSAKSFLKEILAKYYEMSASHIQRLTPPSIRDLYDDPAKFGWEQIGEERPGAIEFDRHQVAFVLGKDNLLAHDARLPLTLRTAPLVVAEGVRNLLHPSSHNGGVGKSAEKSLFHDRSAPPKIAIPKVEPPSSDIPVAWNAWFDQLPVRPGDRPRYHPLRRLDPGQRYEFVAHFAGFNYKSLYSIPAGIDSLSRMTNLARTTDKQTEHLSAVILTDEAGLHAERNQIEFDFDIAALRRWDVAPPFAVDFDPMTYLAKYGTGPFVFGEIRVEVRTKDREGLTVLGVSVWDRDGWPLDEMTVPICVAKSENSAREVCSEQPLIGRGYGAYDLERMSLKAGPAAAIHFIDLGHGGVNAVFRRGDDPECRETYVWKIHQTEEQLVGALSSMARDFAAPDADEEERARVGERVRDLLFAAGEPDNVEARTARIAFGEFARKHMHELPDSGRAAPVLFVRMTPRRRDDDPPPSVRILPFGMLKVDRNPESYLGFFFRIETPLVRQIADDRNECAARWKLIIPPLDSSLRSIREHIERNLNSWVRSSRPVLDKMEEVRGYLKTETRDRERTTIVILSHYGVPRVNAPARIKFDRGYFSSDEIQRVYELPSVALLSGCGTAEIGAESFAQQLNMHGVDAIVAATTSISAEMGVQFFDCLENAMSRGRDHEAKRPLSEVVFEGVQCLRDRVPDFPANPGTRGRPHGAAALAFTLLGNGRLPLCEPEGRTR